MWPFVCACVIIIYVLAEPSCAHAYKCKCMFVRYTSVRHVDTYHCHPSADVWGEGDLPPGWREISDSSEVYFWHVPTGTTQYHRPVASSNQCISPNNEPDTERDPQLEMQDSLKPPNEVRATYLTHLEIPSNPHTHAHHSVRKHTFVQVNY